MGIIGSQKPTPLKKLKSMSQKVCYLLTSPEKFQTTHGNGCCNGASESNTGKKVSAILLPNNGSSSESVTPNLSTDACNDAERPLHSALDVISLKKMTTREVYKRVKDNLWEISHYNNNGDFLFSELRPMSSGSPTVTATDTPKLSKDAPRLTRQSLLSWLKTSSPDTK